MVSRIYAFCLRLMLLVSGLNSFPTSFSHNLSNIFASLNVFFQLLTLMNLASASVGVGRLILLGERPLTTLILLFYTRRKIKDIALLTNFVDSGLRSWPEFSKLSRKVVIFSLGLLIYQVFRPFLAIKMYGLQRSITFYDDIRLHNFFPFGGYLALILGTIMRILFELTLMPALTSLYVLAYASTEYLYQPFSEASLRPRQSSKRIIEFRNKRMEVRDMKKMIESNLSILPLIWLWSIFGLITIDGGLLLKLNRTSFRIVPVFAFVRLYAVALYIYAILIIIEVQEKEKRLVRASKVISHDNNLNLVNLFDVNFCLYDKLNKRLKPSVFGLFHLRRLTLLRLSGSSFSFFVLFKNLFAEEFREIVTGSPGNGTAKSLECKC